MPYFVTVKTSFAFKTFLSDMSIFIANTAGYVIKLKLSVYYNILPLFLRNLITISFRLCILSSCAVVIVGVIL